MEIRAHEQIAREVIDGLTDDILGYINPTNDNCLAPWMMALERAKETVVAIQSVCDAISARPTMNPGQMALRAVADEPPFSEEPFAEDIARTIAARKAMGYKVGDTIRLLEEHWAVQEGSCPSGTTAQLIEGRGNGSFECSPIPGYGLGFVFSPDAYTPSEVERVDTAIPVNSAEEDAAMDAIEQAHPAPCFSPASILDDALRIVRPPMGKAV